MTIIHLYPVFAMDEKTDDHSAASFRLPASLKIINTEAFSGTAVETVILPDGLLYIGGHAFDDTLFLTDVFIPPTVNYISNSAFSSTMLVAIHGAEGSFAQEWAMAHKVSFVTDDIWKSAVPVDDNTSRLSISLAFLQNFILFGTIFKKVPRPKHRDRSMRPQDRPELYPINYRFP